MIRHPGARKAVLLASSSAVAMLLAGGAQAAPLSQHISSSQSQATGGVTVNSAVAAGLPLTVANPAQVSAQQAQTTANLATAAQRLQAALQAQAAARAAPGADTSVPNGLVAGGLQVDPRATDPSAGGYNPLYWIGAQQPTQSGSTVTINQTQAQAILNWRSFNVGQNTTLNFVQKDPITGADAPTWVALNKVNDPSANPTRILGQINAPGSVYIVNRNGIVFGASSTINVHGLAAAAADYASSTLNNDPASFQTAFNTNGLNSPVTAANTGGGVGYVYAPTFVNAGGSVTVAPGALITTAAPDLVTQGGGYVMLMGSKVSNAGSITVPSGQAALIAGDNFYIRPGYSPGDSSGSIQNNNTVSTTRGAEVGYSINNGSSAGQVSNTGVILSTVGDVTLAGQAVVQDGVAVSTTRVSQRGTIHLLTNQDDPTSSVTLTANSLTYISPDLADTSTALDSQRAALIAASKPIGQNPYRYVPSSTGGLGLNQFDDLGLLTDRLDESRVEVTTGGVADFQGGSLTMAQGGQIAVSAINRALVRTGANLDVSGSLNVSLPMLANIITVNIQGNELRDAPVNRNAADLFNDNLYIDQRSLVLVPAGTDGYATDRYYTGGGLVEVSGWLANTGHTIGEWTAQGGGITLSSGLPMAATPFSQVTFPNGLPVGGSSLAGSVVVQPGAVFNLSGGSIDYSGGYVHTTMLRASDGQIYNIDNAPADMTYTGLANAFSVDHSRWVVTQYYAAGLMGGEVYEPGYVVGKDAGLLTLDSPTVLFEGRIAAGVVTGVNQVAARPANATDSYLLPQSVVPMAGGLTIQTNLDTFAPGNASAGQPGDIRFTGALPTAADQVTATGDLPQGRANTAWFDANAIDSFDLGQLTILASNPLTIDTPLTFAPGGQVNITALSADLGASITARSGSVTVVTTPNIRDPSYSILGSRPIDITLESGATIDTRGVFTNERFDPLSRIGQAYIQGGAVSLSAFDGIVLKAGSTIDASGGGYVSSKGASTIGNGGAITLLADQYDATGGGGGGAALTSLGNVDAVLRIDGTLRSYGAKGGALTLQFPQDLIIGDGVQLNGTTLAAGQVAPGNLELTADLTIAAGQPLPMAYNAVTSTIGYIPPGSTLSSTYQIANGLQIAAPWSNPTFGGIGISTNGGPLQWYYYGDLIPGNSVVVNADQTTLPSGYVIPSDAFPQGLPNGAVITAAQIAAGATYTSDVTYKAGTIIPIGSVFKTDVPIGHVLTLPTSFFQQGFSSYTLTNFADTAIRPGAQVNVVEPTYQATPQTLFASSGSDPSHAFSATLAPIYLANPTSGAITQRPGASLTLTTAASRGTSYTNVTYTGSYLPGTVLTQDLPANTTVVLQGPFTIDAFEPNGLYAQVPGGRYPQYYYAGSTLPAGSVITTSQYQTFGAGETIPVSAVGAAPIPTGKTLTTYARSVTLTMGAGAAIAVDPAQSVTLSTPGQLTVDGAITAHGGTVNLLNTASIEDTLDTHALDVTLSGLSIWLGSSSRIDTSAVAFTGLTGMGRAVGTTPDGGSINIGNQGTLPSPSFPIASTPAFVVIRPGAVLDADGTSADIDLAPTQADSTTTHVVSNGGSISLNSFSGLFNDGMLTARAGGAGAFGGSLALAIPALIYSVDTQNGPNPNVPLTMQGPRYLEISQDTVRSLADGAIAGAPNPGLVVGQAKLSVQQVQAGGFDSLTLTSSGGFNFDGDVNLTVGRSLTFVDHFNGGFSDTTDKAKVVLQAPYVRLTGEVAGQGPRDYQWTPPGQTGAGVGADLSVIAGLPGVAGSGLMDVTDGLSFDKSFGTVELTSEGDLRFATGQIYVSTGNNSLSGNTIEPGQGDLTLTAQRVYALPTANVDVYVNGNLKIAPIGDPQSQPTPDTFFSQMSFIGGTIDQGGALFAPQGSISLTGYQVELQAGSLTSVSSNGLLLPYGGSVDGLNYKINNTVINTTGGVPSISLIGGSYYANLPGGLQVDQGAVLDVSGGGDFQGKAFISGRGGSVDSLVNPLMTFSGGTYNSHSANQVYAIVPGWSQAYSPVGGQTIDGSADPAPSNMGQQITIPAGVPGLPAGRYTLLPSEYALLPGGFRVELQGPAKSVLPGAMEKPDGSYLVDAVQSVANTTLVSSVPTVAQISSGSVLRTYSQYAATTLSQAQAATAAQLSADTIAQTYITVTPSMANAGQINLSLPAGGLFDYAGTSRFTPGPGGVPGVVSIYSGVPVEISSDAGPEPTTQHQVAVFPASSLSAMGAPILQIITGGSQYDTVPLTIDTGATLRGSTIVLIAPASVFEVQTGAKILADTQLMLLAPDSNWTCAQYGGCVASAPPGSLILDPGSTVVSQGSLLLSGTSLYIDPAAVLGASSLNLTSNAINIGSAQTLAADASVLPSGLALTQDRISQFLNGDAASGIPALRDLTLTAPNSINFVGSVNLSASGPGLGLQTLTLDTPAVYGLGSSSDTVRIAAHELVWDGYFQAGSYEPAPGIFPGFPGSGHGSLTVAADQIVLGSPTPGVAFYTQTSYLPAQINPTGGDQELAATATRLLSGFSSVDLQATQSISSNGHGNLTVSQSDGSAADLALTTPLLTAAPGSVMSYVVSGNLTVAPPLGAQAAAFSSLDSLGGEISLSANAVDIASAIVVKSGKLTVNATGDIVLAPGSRLDLSGQGTAFFGLIQYSWGGDLILTSANGDILQSAGSTIDVSAVGNTAGTVFAQAVGANGEVALGGTLLGGATTPAGALDVGGQITVDAQTLSGTAASLSADFDALNATLDAGGFTGGRLFDFKQGDLTINRTVKAADFEVSVDAGSLTVNGLIDASGIKPGMIRLAAQNDLTLAGSSVLDAHATVAHLDNYGAAIESENRAYIELAAVTGTLTLAPGATMDVSSQLATPLGDIELNVSRTGETSGDARINASGPLNIKGAQTIAINAFQVYKPTDANGTIVQDNGDPNNLGVAAATGFVGLNQINVQNTAFIDNALVNGAFLQKIAGVTAYTDAAHLRPGVEIDSATDMGDLTVSGDLDFSGFRYASLNPHSQRNADTASGEPGFLVLRAGADLIIHGSLNDGFYDPPSSPDGYPTPGTVYLASNVMTTTSVTFTSLPQAGPGERVSGRYFYFYYYNRPTVVTGEVDTPYGSFLPGDTIRYFSVGTTIQAGTTLSFPHTADGTPELAGLPGLQPAPIWALSSQMPAGDLSWSMRLTSGADLHAADTRITKPKSVLDATGAPAYVTPIFTSTATLANNVPLANAVTFERVPTVDPGTGATNSIFRFYFPGDCGYYCSNATVVSGHITAGSYNWGPGQQIGQFTASYGVTFAAGTQISIAGVGAGVPIMTGVSITGGQAVAAIPTKGNIILDDKHAGFTYVPPPAYGGTPTTAEVFSVIRTGTGNLDLNTGEDYIEKTPFGVYTAGVQSPAVWLDSDPNHLGVPNPILPLAQNTVYVSDGVPVSTTVTFNTLPDPDTSRGDQSRFGTFYFGQAPTVVSGEVDDNGNAYTAGQQLPSFRTGAIFQKGTVLSFPGLNDGDPALEKLGYPNLANGPAMVNPFNLPLAPMQILASFGRTPSGTVLGDTFSDPSNPSLDYAAAIAGYQAYYPESGGNIRISAQGNISQSPYTNDSSSKAGAFGLQQPDAVANWLWRQGGANTAQPTAWWINFGTYLNPSTFGPNLVGFQGVGALGGGNVTLLAGGSINYLDAAVGSTGRVTGVTMAGQVVTGGNLVQTGGGDLTVRAGGDISGTVVNLRGDISLHGSTIGDTNSFVQTDPSPQYSYGRYYPLGGQPYIYGGYEIGPAGVAVVQGDATATLQARGNLFVSGEADAGLSPNTEFYGISTGVSGADAGETSLSQAWFSLYTPRTSLMMESLGGDVVPLFGNAVISNDNISVLPGAPTAVYLAPSNLKVIADTGNIILQGKFNFQGGEGDDVTFEAMPSAHGDVEFIAGTNVQGINLFNGIADQSASSGYQLLLNAPNEYPTTIIGVSGANADPNSLANPFRSAAFLFSDGANALYGSPFVYEVDRPTTQLHADDSTPFRVYAKNGNIESIAVNDMAKLADIEAGGNITYLFGQLSNVNVGDVSVIAAGGTILYPDVAIAGPGQLSVEAGRDVFMGISPDAGYIYARDPLFGFTVNGRVSSFTSTGLWFGQNGSVSGGAGISIVAGTQDNPPDYAAVAALYLNPANQQDFAYPLDFPQNAGKVVHTYQDELYSWLKTIYGYTGTEANQLAFFYGLLPEQQDVFLRQVYFKELDQADVEFNDPLSPLFKSYVRGRTAISTLYPGQGGASIQAVDTGDATGSVIMYAGSGVHTNFGGDINILTPGGPTTVGVEGPNPPSTAGVITQGSGSVNIYALDSVELGQSRVFTTYGGAITIWSADGDINAGRGAKTTVVYSPPLLTYDDFGNYTLSPTVPTSGAGIATLAPIPQVPPGDVYLVAPFGTIDAGEAGIRVSGNAFLAAAHIVNAANIQVKGNIEGLPPKPTTNLSLATTSSATREVTAAAQAVAQAQALRDSVVTVEVIGFGGDDSSCANPATRSAQCPK